MSIPKLDTCTSECIVSIIEHCVQKQKKLHSTPIDMHLFSDVLSISLGGDIQKLYNQQCNTQLQLKNMLQKRESVQHLENKTELRNVQTEIHHLEQRWKNTRKELTKCFRDHPIIAPNISKIQRQMLQCIHILSETIYEIQSHGTFQTLGTYLQTITSLPIKHETQKIEEGQLTARLNELKKECQSKETLNEKHINEIEQHITLVTNEVLSLKSRIGITFHEKEVSSKLQSTIKSLRQKELKSEAKIGRVLNCHLKYIQSKLCLYVCSVFANVAFFFYFFSVELGQMLANEEKAHATLINFLQHKCATLQEKKQTHGDAHKKDLSSKMADIISISANRESNLQILLVRWSL